MERGADIERAKEALMAGNLVAVPTETVYGLAGNATQEEVVAKIFAAKKRPFFDPLIVHFSTIEQLNDYVLEITPVAKKLLQAFSPGPITCVLHRNHRIPDLVTSGLPTVGVRIPAHPVLQELLDHLPFPLAAPSANVFGYISPTSPQHVQKQFGEEVAYLLDGGDCVHGLESTIVDCTVEPVQILRKGALEVERIRAVLGYTPVEATVSSSRPSAPGNVDVHYAPRTPLFVVDDLAKQEFPPQSAILGFGLEKKPEGVAVFELSPSKNLIEAAANFFRFLHQLDDDHGVNQIFATWFPEESLGKALNDKLRRAGHNKSDFLK
jgi:L-threonylcarbamoyladenylate synthase